MDDIDLKSLPELKLKLMRMTQCIESLEKEIQLIEAGQYDDKLQYLVNNPLGHQFIDLKGNLKLPLPPILKILKQHNTNSSNNNYNVFENIKCDTGIKAHIVKAQNIVPDVADHPMPSEVLSTVANERSEVIVQSMRSVECVPSGTNRKRGKSISHQATMSKQEVGNGATEELFEQQVEDYGNDTSKHKRSVSVSSFKSPHCSGKKESVGIEDSLVTDTEQPGSDTFTPKRSARLSLGGR